MTQIRNILAGSVALVAASFSTEAGAVSLSVKLACASDYYRYCSQHSPGSLGVRKCMRANGRNLSRRCVNALVDAGMVSSAYVRRRRTAAAK